MPSRNRQSANPANPATDAANPANPATDTADTAGTTAEVAVAFDVDALLSKLDGASWKPAVTTASAGGSLINWPENLKERAKAAGFHLWPMLPARATINGMSDDRRLATAPVDLSRLNLPPMSERIKENGEVARDLTATKFLTQLASGIITTDAGIVSIPALGKGQNLPVALIVAAYATVPLALKTGKRSDYLSRLFADRKASVMSRLSDIVGRYIYLDVKRFELVATDTLR